MAKMYANMIQKGIWTLQQVPIKWYLEVEKLLQQA